MIDVYASLANLLEHEIPAGSAPDSRNRLDVLLGKQPTEKAYIVQQNLDNTLSLILGDWKYIEPSNKPALEYWTKTEMGNDPMPQLYDLANDPSEQHNIAQQHPDVVQELSSLLKDIKAAGQK